MKKNKLIILNGTSSSGKTTLAEAFTEISGDCYYHITMDAIMGFLPKKYLIFRNHNEINSNCSYVLTDENKKGFYFSSKDEPIKMGEYAKNVYSDIFPIIKTLMERGRNIIFDGISFDIEELKKSVASLKGFDVYIVRVFCDVDELRVREKNRGNRIIGSAEKSIHLIDTKYNDFVVDTTKKTPKELALELMEFINNNKAIAFNGMY